jgi:putative acetyltransferase
MDFRIRVAEPEDASAMAEAHRDSIESIGPRFYASNEIEAWTAGLTDDLYLRAMSGGEVFFVAAGRLGGRQVVLGFASDYAIEGTKHGTSVYVRGAAARRRIGTALLQRAEAHARAAGATTIEIEASLAGVEFYRTNGYVDVREVQTRLVSGHRIATIIMRKDLDT